MQRPKTASVVKRPAGMAGFSLVWLGQMVSVLASNMTGFALTIWMFQQTRSATAMGVMQVCFLAPFLLISPFAGAMVDRYNRKLMMMVSDLVAVTATCAILLLQATGHLQFWHLYIATIVEGLGSAFQWPAYLAAISVMVPKEQYGRANGMMSLIDSGPGVFAPILAGALLPFIGLTGILLIDVATFCWPSPLCSWSRSAARAHGRGQGRRGQPAARSGLRLQVYLCPAAAARPAIDHHAPQPGAGPFRGDVDGAHDPVTNGRQQRCPGRRGICLGHRRGRGRAAHERLGRA